ncbi:Hypothetical protein PENO1_106740 [Penicillium occitanis (nom. inval.)]|nr:Hypothetical protein PENO1_106740 [Penicillium occitanis (nom. inval.)]PCG89294.1 hypothetical protein PENOC_107130 [Penicillium occitanis (nom. inval.)]
MLSRSKHIAVHTTDRGEALPGMTSKIANQGERSFNGDKPSGNKRKFIMYNPTATNVRSLRSGAGVRKRKSNQSPQRPEGSESPQDGTTTPIPTGDCDSRRLSAQYFSPASSKRPERHALPENANNDLINHLRVTDEERRLLCNWRESANKSPEAMEYRNEDYTSSTWPEALRCFRVTNAERQFLGELWETSERPV